MATKSKEAAKKKVAKKQEAQPEKVVQSAEIRPSNSQSQLITPQMACGVLPNPIKKDDGE